MREQVISEQVYQKEKFQAEGRTNVKALESKKSVVCLRNNIKPADTELSTRAEIIITEHYCLCERQRVLF